MEIIEGARDCGVPLENRRARPPKENRFFPTLAGLCLRVTVIESIVRDLQGMPARKLVEVARYVHRLSEHVRHERAEVLRETHGYMDKSEGALFEAALAESRRMDNDG